MSDDRSDATPKGSGKQFAKDETDLHEGDPGDTPEGSGKQFAEPEQDHDRH